MKFLVHGFLAAATAAFMGVAANAATVVSATGNTTVIDTGTTRLAFLDLTLTTRLTIADALAGNPGYSWATLDQVNALLSAFNLPLNEKEIATWAGELLEATAEDVQAFQAALGATASGTNTGFSVGLLDIGVSGRDDALINVRFLDALVDAQDLNDVFFRSDDFPGGYGGNATNDRVGYFLVRDLGQIVVPLPAPALLLIGALGALGIAGRRRA